MWMLKFENNDKRLENNAGEGPLFRFSAWLENRVMHVPKSCRRGNTKSTEPGVIRLLQDSYIQSIQCRSISEKIMGPLRGLFPLT